MEKIETLVGKIKIRASEVIAENKRLKDEKHHLNEKYQEMKSQLESKNSELQKLQERIRDFENDKNTRNTDDVSLNKKQIKNEIDGILKEIDQCLTLINK